MWSSQRTPTQAPWPNTWSLCAEVLERRCLDDGVALDRWVAEGEHYRKLKIMADPKGSTSARPHMHSKDATGWWASLAYVGPRNEAGFTNYDSAGAKD